MKKSFWMGITGILGMLAFLGTAAAAQSSIFLMGGAGQQITFTGQGSGTQNIGVSLGSCSSTSCTFSGTASGTGSLQSVGNFTLNSSANSIMLAPTGGGAYNATSTAPINFSLVGGSGTLLTGSLNLVNFSQSQGTSEGEFNSNLASNFTVMGGSLAGAFGGSPGVLNLDVTLPGTSNISTLSGTTQSLAATLSADCASGISPTPEPSTLVLMGVGLLALGFGVRRARTQAGLA